MIEQFAYHIETIRNEKNIDYIDAILLFCERNKIEIEQMASIVSRDPSLKLKVRAEGENLNILKRGAKLPV